MLECGKNFKGTMSERCSTCAVVDDENHRLNECFLWKETNRVNESHKVNFCDIYSSDFTVPPNTFNLTTLLFMIRCVMIMRIVTC